MKKQEKMYYFGNIFKNMAQIQKKVMGSNIFFHQGSPVDKGELCDIIRKESEKCHEETSVDAQPKRTVKRCEPCGRAIDTATSERTARSRTVMPPLPGSLRYSPVGIN